jgi:hypothetical protein
MLIDWNLILESIFLFSDFIAICLIIAMTLYAIIISADLIRTVWANLLDPNITLHIKRSIKSTESYPRFDTD